MGEVRAEREGEEGGEVSWDCCVEEGWEEEGSWDG